MSRIIWYFNYSQSFCNFLFQRLLLQLSHYSQMAIVEKAQEVNRNFFSLKQIPTYYKYSQNFCTISLNKGRMNFKDNNSRSRALVRLINKTINGPFYLRISQNSQVLCWKPHKTNDLFVRNLLTTAGQWNIMIILQDRW